MANRTLTTHHLIWTRRDWQDFPLRSIKVATIELPKKTHEKLHLDNPPLEPLSNDAMRLVLSVAESHYKDIDTPRSVLTVMQRVFGWVSEDEQISKEDYHTTIQNLLKLHRQIIWLDTHYPKWSKR